eukprot:m.45162 g.45162  ORF g.45162 m.45162 type:complete len:533 (+) comp5861_c0_seq2:40-1638(+)
MEDIEDMAGDEPRGPRTMIVSKRFRGKQEPAAGDNIPATEAVFIRTWGCSHNNSDSEYMAGVLAASGFQVTGSADDADVWILNSCTVKTPSEDNFNNAIKEARAKGKHVVVAGCVPQGQRKEYDSLSVIGVQQIDRVAEVVEATLQGASVRLLDTRRDGQRTAGARLDLPKIRKNRLIEIVPINSGCLNHCTYCKTKHARGDLASYPPDEIVERIRSVIAEGVREIWMTSEDTGAYGRDIGTSLPAMLDRVVAVLPEGTMLRLGMTNPPYIREHLEAMARILRHPRVYAFLHVPVQSAADPILAAMRREYSQADFCEVVDYLREQVPGISIATDMICGFPGETDEDHQESMELVRQYRFPSLFINQFYPRPGTPAASLPRVPGPVAKSRTREMSAFFKSYSPYDGRVGQVYTVLVTETAADGVHYVGHNKYYEQVLVPLRDDLLGHMVAVRIVETGKFFMRGELIDDSLRSPHVLIGAPRADAVPHEGPTSPRSPAAVAGPGPGLLSPLTVLPALVVVAATAVLLVRHAARP